MHHATFWASEFGVAKVVYGVPWRQELQCKILRELLAPNQRPGRHWETFQLTRPYSFVLQYSSQVKGLL